MLKLSKKVEYGLIAVKHIALEKPGETLTAKEISQKYEIPYELLSKILQKLAKEKIIASYQGSRGGYSLLVKPDELKISNIIEAIEGPQYLTECMDNENCDCNKTDCCTIKNPLEKVQSNINEIFNKLTLSEII